MKTQTHKHKQTSFNQKDRNKPHRATMHPDFVTVQTKYQAEHGTWYMEEQMIKRDPQKCTNCVLYSDCHHHGQKVPLPAFKA